MNMLLKKPRILFVEQPGDDLFVVDGRIRYHEAREGKTVIGERWFVVPGLVDAHAHLVTSPSIGVPGYTEARQMRPEALRQRMVEHLEAQRAAGVLAVRDAGDPTGQVAELMRELDSSLPYLQAAGVFIAPPGRYLPNSAHEVSGDDIERMAIAEAARGGGWVKLIGDSEPRNQPGKAPDIGWPVEDVKRAIDTAHKAGARVAMHVTTPEAIAMAIELGVDSIEHGAHMKPEHVERMAQCGRAWTPTLAAFRIFLRRIRSKELWMHEGCFAESVEAIERHLPQAVAAGVTILCGTDGALDHGKVGLEVLALIEAGLTPEQAIRAATIDSWKYLRLGDPLAEGASADFVAYERDPFSDPEVLLTPKLVVRSGQVVGGTL